MKISSESTRVGTDEKRKRTNLTPFSSTKVLVNPKRVAHPMPLSFFLPDASLTWCVLALQHGLEALQANNRAVGKLT
jgi:hypothetical protein